MPDSDFVERVGAAIGDAVRGMPGVTVQRNVAPLAMAGRETPKMAVRAIEKTDNQTGGVAADRLRSIVERIERLEEERKSLGNDIKDIFQEAKSAGFSVPVLRQLIRIRSKDAAEVEEQESLLDVYRAALGM